MRLINCRTLQLEEFAPRNIPPYGILSHTWGSVNDEVAYTDFIGDDPGGLVSPTKRVRDKHGFFKIQKGCEEALADDCEYLWVDTCCIDKRSSAELTESINSMYNWYESAENCYAYLEDVSREDDELLPTSSSARRTKGEGLDSRADDRPRLSAYVRMGFKISRWFRRGWTLQELLAPKKVRFFDEFWDFLGTREHLYDIITEITFIPPSVLLGQEDIMARSIACRMSWAARRETTRPEDIAYCLLGIFQVNMPLLYGEGGDRAYRRLQDEIMKHSADQSLFAWGPSSDDMYQDVEHCLEAIRIMDVGRKLPSVLASHPSDFMDCENIVGFDASSGSFTMTNNGLLIELPLATATNSDESALAVLSCGYEQCYDRLVAIPLRRLGASSMHWGRYGSGAMSFPYRRLDRLTTREIYISRQEETIEKPGAVRYVSVEVTAMASTNIVVDSVYPIIAWARESRSIDLQRVQTLDKYIYIYLTHWTTDDSSFSIADETDNIVVTISLSPDRLSGTIQVRRNIGEPQDYDQSYATLSTAASSLNPDFRAPRNTSSKSVGPRIARPKIDGEAVTTSPVSKPTRSQRPIPQLILTEASDDEDSIASGSESESIKQSIKPKSVKKSTNSESNNRSAKPQNVPPKQVQTTGPLTTPPPWVPLPTSNLAARPSNDIAEGKTMTLRDGTVLHAGLTCEERLGQKILVMTIDNLRASLAGLSTLASTTGASS